MTMLLLGFLSLLVLSQFQRVFLYHKSMNQLLAKQEAFYQFEAAMSKIISNNQFTENQACVTSEQDPNSVIEQLKNRQACSLYYKKQQYRYVIEALGVFPCIQTTVDHNIHGTKHWRITMITTEKMPRVLQVRVASSVQLTPCESAESAQITGRVLSWRYLQ